ncbi:MAG: TonB-dependent receptor [Parabacteroides sp.]|nr:TonB-dependent receptor [Parabacteroides sp.]
MKKLTFLFLCLVIGIGLATAQTRQITGTVISAEDDQPVIGASVVVKGTTTGTVTDYDGKFSLNVPTNAKSLVVSYIGMESVDAAISSNMRVVLKSSSQQLDEVMVVAYGTAKKSSFTGSAKAVSSDDITSGSKESLDKALAGKLSGVRVSSSTGDPGSPGEINIRGVGSISASKSPLYVVDGVAVKSDGDMSYYGKSSSILSSLNPEDIESMTVLKDAAAASLYGSRAANGVIIITTKSGKLGKTKVSYTGEIGWSSMAVDQFNPMSSTELLEYAKEALSNYYIYYGDASNREEGYALVESEGDMEYFFNDPSGKTNTNWKKEVYRTALTQDHQVSINGGNEKTQFYTGFGFNKAEGIIIGSDFERFSGRLNLDHQVNDWLKFGVKQMITYTTQNGPRDQGDQAQGIGTSAPLSLVFSGDPTAPVKNEDGTYNENANWGAASNPHLMLGIEEWIVSKMMRSMSNANVNVKLSDKVTFKSIFGYDFMDTKHFEYWSPEGVNGASVGGLGSRYNYESRNLTSSSTLRYANTWDDVHNFDILGGFEVEDRNLLSVIATAKQYGTDKLPELGNGQPDNAYSNVYASGILSYLASANYNYDNKYYLSASARRDGSSRLGADNRWANFWSVSGAWRISGESFLEDNELFSDLKVRASYGTNGNLPGDYYANLPLLYTFNDGYGPNPAIYWSQFGNTNLGWEKSKNMNVGFDWNIFRKVNLTVEYYNKITTDLLFQVPSSIVTGFDSNWANLGKLKNDGIEVEISSQNIKTGDFSWNTSFNATFQNSTIKELPDGKDIQYGDGNMYLHREGESMYTFYLPEWKGVNPETGLGEFWKDPSDHSLGVVNSYAQAGKGIVGKAVPDVIGGLTNTFNYKEFDLSFLITYQFGGDMFDYPGYFFHNDGVRIGSFNLDKEVAGNYWKNPGDIVDYPKPIYGNPYRPDRFSSRTILSTDNVRMREITLGYNVPGLKNIFDNVRVYFRANNPFMIWAATDGVDPDVSLNGYRQVDTPQTKSFTFGVSVTL